MCICWVVPRRTRVLGCPATESFKMIKKRMIDLTKRCGLAIRPARMFSYVMGSLIACSAWSQWTVVELDPPGSNQAQARHVGQHGQVGYSRFGTNWNAGFWNGTAASWVNLHPSGATSSFAHAADGNQQVGNFSAPGITSHAALWTGTAASFVDLHPTGATISFASDVQNGVQVGRANVGGFFQASVWTGTAESWQSLHPSGASASALFAIDGAFQGGNATIGGVSHAGLWSGSASSFVSLRPEGLPSSEGSVVWAIHGGQQVGDVGPFNGFSAALWQGTAASYVSLAPTGSTQSTAVSVFDGWQAGQATVGGVAQASLWHSTAASWESLHNSLPSGRTWMSSIARSVWHDGTTLYVAGYAEELGTGQHAFLWSRPVPEPASLLALVAGLAGLAMRLRRNA